MAIKNLSSLNCLLKKMSPAKQKNFSETRKKSRSVTVKKYDQYLLKPIQEALLQKDKLKREQETSKAIQEQNATLEKSDYTFDLKGKIILVKKNTKFANFAQGSSFSVKDPE